MTLSCGCSGPEVLLAVGDDDDHLYAADADADVVEAIVTWPPEFKRCRVGPGPTSQAARSIKSPAVVSMRFKKILEIFRGRLRLRLWSRVALQTAPETARGRSYIDRGLCRAGWVATSGQPHQRAARERVMCLDRFGRPR